MKIVNYNNKIINKKLRFIKSRLLRMKLRYLIIKIHKNNKMKFKSFIKITRNFIKIINTLIIIKRFIKKNYL